MTSYPVQPAIVVIPNGGDQNVVRLNLRVTPFRPDPAEGTPAQQAVPLEVWPDAIAALANGSFRIDLAPIQDVSTLGSGRATVGRYAAIGASGVAATGAMRLWGETFSASDLATLWQELVGPDRAAPLSGAPTELKLAPRFDSATLGEALIDVHAKSAVACVEALLAGAGVAADQAPPPASLDAPLTAHEAWSIPVKARGTLAKFRKAELATQRTSKFCSTVAAMVPASAPRALWHDAKSHAELDAIHNAERLMCRFDPKLDAAVRATRPTDPIELLASRMESIALALESVSAPLTVRDDDAPDSVRDVHRKLTAILNYPLIAKFLGMSFDVVIRRSDWQKAASDLGSPIALAVSASFGDTASDHGTSWTGLVDLPALADGTPPYFGPADPAELGLAPVAGRKFVRGMLDLGATSRHGGARYQLQIIDSISMSLRTCSHAASMTEASLESRPFNDELPEVNGRGIALLDKDVHDDAADALKRDQDLQQPKATKLLFAGDLVNGYRPMVGITLKNSESMDVPADRWRSLVARHITYGGAIDQKFTETNFDPEREHGYVKTIATEQCGQPRLFSEMFVWTGDSLGVPSHNVGADKNALEADATQDLPVDITYQLPSPAPGVGLPPLRDGRSYVFGLSACFLNGCGPTIIQSMTAHAHAMSTKHLLGSEDGRAYRYVRCERIPPPVVLLRDGTPIVTTENVDSLRGETLTTLVIREGDGSRAQRYLYPARIEFDRAEQQNMFGAADGDVPKGAFQRFGVTRTSNGDFPRAEGGGVATGDPLTDPKAKNSRGPVIRFTDPDNVSVRPYYPDGYSNGVWTRFTPSVPASGATLVAMTKPAPYRKASDPAVSARPVMLELQAGKKSDPRRVWIDTRDTVAPDQPDGVALSKISIVLAPATIVDVALDTDFDPVAALTGHLLSEPLMASWGMRGLADVPRATAKLSQALRAGRITALQGKSVLRLVHAVKKPLVPPRQIELVPVLASVAPEGKSSPSNPSWSDIVDANITAGIPFAEWSQPGGATCFFVGSVGLDAPSTGGLGLDAIWEDYGPEMVVRDGKKWIERRVEQKGRLFSIGQVESDINRPNGVSEDEVSLVVDKLKNKRSLSFGFSDGRARQLRTRLMAASRFIDYYRVTNPIGVKPGEPGDCEAAAIAWQPIWIPCTYRPSAFDIKRVTPWFAYQQTDEQGVQEYTFARDVSYRVEVGRDGYMSGEDERLALVFPSGDPDICDYAEQSLKPFAASLTRWGSDPLHITPVPQRNIGTARFTGAIGPAVEQLSLLPGADPVDGSANTATPISATALPFRLVLDPATGTYYSDIKISPVTTIDDAYMPFVQLGLSRYQPHCVKGLELSLPVGHTVQLFPRRSGSIRFKKRSEGRTFTLQVHGQVDPTSQYTTLLDVTALMRADNGHERPRWIPQFKDGKIKKLEGLKPNADGWTVTDFTMPMSRYSGDNWLGVLIEEYEICEDSEGRPHKRIVYGQIIDFQQATQPPPP